MTFLSCTGENSDLHHTAEKTQHLHHAVVKIQIFSTFTPCRGQNLDFDDIYTTP